MKTFFVEQSKRTGIIQHIFKKVLKKGNKILINTNLEKVSFKTKVKIARKIRNILMQENSKQIVLEEKLKADKQFLNLLYGYDINICNPKWLFKMLTNDIIDDVLKDKKREKSEIWICVNEVDSWVEENIYKFADEFKNINIVTNHIGRFKRIEEKLYEKNGILINLSNNKRKSLLKASLILNVDFPKELINQFTILDEAFIIDLEGKIKIRKKRFHGKIISDYKIIVKEDGQISNFIKKYDLHQYDIRDVCQAIEKVPESEINVAIST